MWVDTFTSFASGCLRAAFPACGADVRLTNRRQHLRRIAWEVTSPVAVDRIDFSLTAGRLSGPSAAPFYVQRRPLGRLDTTTLTNGTHILSSTATTPPEPRSQPHPRPSPSPTVLPLRPRRRCRPSRSATSRSPRRRRHDDGDRDAHALGADDDRDDGRQVDGERHRYCGQRLHRRLRDCDLPRPGRRRRRSRCRCSATRRSRRTRRSRPCSPLRVVSPSQTARA